VTLYTICSEDELEVDQFKPFSAGDTKVLLYRLTDGYYATQHNCTHIFAPLAKGKIVDSCLIQCPFHRARFDIKTGAVVDWANFPPGVQLLNAVRGKKALQTYPVTVDGGSIVVSIPD